MDDWVIRKIIAGSIFLLLIFGGVIASAIARKKEAGADPMGDFVIRESKALFGGGLAIIIFFCLAYIGLAYYDYVNGFTYTFLDDMIRIGMFGFFIALAALVVIYARVRELRVESGILTYRTLFRAKRVMPLTDIAQVKLDVFPTLGGVAQLILFDNSKKRVTTIRSTLKGFDFLYLRLQRDPRHQEVL
jgi:hypothetical protein